MCLKDFKPRQNSWGRRSNGRLEKKGRSPAWITNMAWLCTCTKCIYVEKFIYWSMYCIESIKSNRKVLSFHPALPPSMHSDRPTTIGCHWRQSCSYSSCCTVRCCLLLLVLLLHLHSVQGKLVHTLWTVNIVFVSVCYTYIIYLHPQSGVVSNFRWFCFNFRRPLSRM